MATDTRQRLSFGVRLKMFVRLLALTALLAVAAGALVLSSVLPDWKIETLSKAVRHQSGQTAMIGAMLFLGGALVVLFAVVVELLSLLQGGSSRRGAAGVNAAVQVAIAAALLVAVNVYAFMHTASLDLTTNKQFTLAENVVSELQKLKSETTIVIMQQHKTFGQLSAKPDRFDYAAERKVVEKVQDLVAQFRRFGPQFKVVVLDVEEEGYDKKLDELTNDKPLLKEAIAAAPENSIFFFSEGKVQRMSFNELYQLDKHASKEANQGKGNLVLHPQGIETIVKRVTAIEEKRPKVAVAVTHPYLSTQPRKGSAAQDYILAGLKKSLNNYGFEVVDVVLKKNYRGELDGDPASYTVQETRLIELEGKLEAAKEELKREKRYTERLARNVKKVEEAQQKPLADRMDIYIDAYADMFRRRYVFSAEDRKDENIQKGFEKYILKQFDFRKKEQDQDLADAEENLKQIEVELAETAKYERAIEDRYLTDVKAKFSRLLADCDLLIIPRLTIMNAATGMYLPRNLHKLDATQADVIKDFMKSGRPVLVCAGPINAPFDTPLPATFDEVETLLQDRGIELAPQTVLFNVESKSFRESASEEDELADTTVDVPPLRFSPPDDWERNQLKPNPIARSMQVLVNSVDQALDISVRAPRPVVVTKNQQERQGFSGDFLWTNARSWNESYPFNFVIQTRPHPLTMQMSRQRVRLTPPRYDAGSDTDDKKPDPLKKGADERRGPFAIAAAVESKVPSSWYGDKEKKPLELPTGRVIAIGHGGIFNGAQLAPATEQLLLVTCNWLLRRDERMPHAADPKAKNPVDRPWEYSRVVMSDGTKRLWHWGTFLGLPAVFVYLGMIVLMMRRVR